MISFNTICSVIALIANSVMILKLVYDAGRRKGRMEKTLAILEREA